MFAYWLLGIPEIKAGSKPFFIMSNIIVFLVIKASIAVRKITANFVRKYVSSLLDSYASLGKLIDSE